MSTNGSSIGRRDMWVHVTTAWRFLGLRIEETGSRGLTTPHRKRKSLLRDVTQDLRQAHVDTVMNFRVPFKAGNL